MLRQTMDKLKRNASNSSVGMISNPNMSKQSFHSNKRINSFSPFNNQESRLSSTPSTPFLHAKSPSNTLRQLLKQDQLSKRQINPQIVSNPKQLRHHNPSSFKKNLTFQHNTNNKLISTNPQSTQYSKNISEQKRLNLQKIQPITPFQSFSDRPSNTQTNKQQFSDAQSLVQINALKSKLSQSFSQKLELQMKLTRSQEHNRLLQNQIISLKKQIKNLVSNIPSSTNTHSFTLTNQNDYIVQLLQEYQQMKQMIQKLIKDNQQLIKKNDKLKTQQTFDGSMQSDLDKFKQFRNANNQLMEELNELRQRSTKENQKKTEQISKLKATLKQKVKDLKKIEELTNLLNDKNNENTQLKQQQTQMNNKMKQVLSELTNFAQKFQKEKMTLIKGHEEYKVKANSQILHLQNIIFRDSKPSTLATVGNIIHIEESLDLNEGCIDAISGDLDADFSLESEVLASMTSDIKNMTNMLTIQIREPTD